MFRDIKPKLSIVCSLFVYRANVYWLLW